MKNAVLTREMWEHVDFTWKNDRTYGLNQDIPGLNHTFLANQHVRLSALQINMAVESSSSIKPHGIHRSELWINITHWDRGQIASKGSQRKAKLDLKWAIEFRFPWIFRKIQCGLTWFKQLLYWKSQRALG